MKGQRQNPFRVCTVAGHDPSNGAGLTADVKVFELLGLPAASVCTAVTVQSAGHFYESHWVAWEQIQAQLQAVVEDGSIHFWKIGLVESSEILTKIVHWIRAYDISAMILWDPILKASAGFSFHQNAQAFQAICPQISLITPNSVEAEWLQVQYLSGLILQKGGHQSNQTSDDLLISNGNIIHSYSKPRIPGAAKHGTGCLLSASILGHLAWGYPLHRALHASRNFLQNYLEQNTGLLGSVRQAFIPPRHPPIPELYAITWENAPYDMLEQVQQLCHAGVELVQLRFKQTPTEQRLTIAQKALEICRTWGATLVINDDVFLAQKIGAPAVHLGLDDMNVADARQILGPQVWIGGTANSPEHVQQRLIEGVDHIGLGPFKHTNTKEKIKPLLGVEGLKKSLQVLQNQPISIPVHAIGGIQISDISAILDCGVQGVAISSALVAEASIAHAVLQFQNAFAEKGILT